MPISIFKKIYTDKTFLITASLAFLAFIFGQVKITDIDVKTIISLLSLLIIIAVYEQLNILTHIANAVVVKSNSLRQLMLVMLLISFFGSMLFTNDVAILTLVPIFFKISQQININKITPISLLTIYANLGSSLTPFGNPQNLYLVSFYDLSLTHFLSLSLPLGFLSFVSLIIASLLFPKSPIDVSPMKLPLLDTNKIIWLSFATLVVLLGLLSFISIWISLLVSILSAHLLKKQVFYKVDYSIILTFINFFLIVGAISRITFIHQLLISTTNNAIDTLFSGIIVSQVISNVPAAVLLSKFTQHIGSLYQGVTIGGLGTLIASLANLLALRQYNLLSHHDVLTFFKVFTKLNFLYLVIFTILGVIITSIS